MPKVQSLAVLTATMHLEQALERLTLADDHLDQERERLVSTMRAALDAGVSQSEVARALGWSRQRVHKTLGGT